MTGLVISVAVGILLLVALYFLGRSGAGVSSRGSWESEYLGCETGRNVLCPAEYVSRIFSGEDADFIKQLRRPELETLFRRERSAVAAHWVRQISANVREIMREHARLARRSRDLNAATEAKLILRYMELMVFCGLLLALIRLVSPASLRSLAMYTNGLSERIAQLGQNFAGAAVPNAKFV